MNNDAASPMNDIELGIGPIVLLVIYLCGMIGLGLLGRAKREENTLSDFYLGGSSFGLFVLFLTFFATQYSGNTMLGFAGRSYRAGGPYVVSILFMALAICVLTFYGPRLYKLARTFGYITPADYIYHRFGSHTLRVVCVLLFCWGLGNYILEQLVAMGHAVEGLSGGKINFMAGVVMLVVVMLVYESLGGMRSVAWTDAVQGVILLIGCSAIFYILVTNEGGLPAAAKEIQENHPVTFEVPDAGGIRNWISTILLLGFGVSVYPHAIQRVFSSKNLRTLQWSLSGMAFMPFVTTLLAFLIGIIAISKYDSLSTLQSDQVTIYMLAEIINMNAFTYWLGVMVFVALVAAIMSTSDSALLSVQSMVTKDIYKPYINPDATPEHLLRVGKIFGWGMMAFLVTMAWVSIKTESSIWLLIKLKLEFMVQIAPVFILGVYSKRLPAKAVLAGVLTGTGITLTLWVGAAFGAWDVAQRSPLNISAGVWGLAANFTICVIGILTAPKETT
jgi:SSS family solute:Na+ symporter